MTAKGARRKEMHAAAPHGLEEIASTSATFTTGSREPQPTLPVDYLSNLEIPFPPFMGSFEERNDLPPAMVGVFALVFGLAQARRLQSNISSFAAVWHFASDDRGRSSPLTVRRIAIHLSPGTNWQSSARGTWPGLIEVFREAGFASGGGWPGKARDPMHFQYCSGY